MKIVSFEVQNYKCFWEKQTIAFSPTSTAILGQNNVGKSALLECLRLIDVHANPHRSTLSIPSEGSTLQKSIRISLKVHLEGSELIEAHSTDSVVQFWIPHSKIKDTEQARAYAVRILQSKAVVLTFTRIWAPPTYNSYQWEMGVEVPAAPQLNFGATHSDQGHLFSQNLPISDPASIYLAGTSSSSLFGPQSSVPWICRSIFRFDAERFNIGASKVGPITKLESNAQNLPTVLSCASLAWRTRFETYLQVVREVLPTVSDITIVPISETHVEIRVSTDTNYEGRQDLSQPIRNCGSGICQVLAMLYVAMFEKRPQVIILDEPDSFLHPGAARKLMQILRKNESRHQYIISTHSTEITRGASPDTLAHIIWDRPRARISMLDPNQMDQMHEAFADLGIQLSDVYGADAIVWVEGPTEKSVLPLIWSKQKSQKNVEFLSVVSTGDFEASRKKARDLVVRIYTELTTAKSLVPPTVGFVFDREAKSPTEIADMEREFAGRVGYLSRRTLENYLLDCDAIAAVVSVEGKSPIAPSIVQDWIEAHASEHQFFDPIPSEATVWSTSWLEKVHAPRLLAALFQNFATTEYRKTTHSLAIARILVESRPQSFDGVLEVVNGVLEASKVA